MIVQGVYDSTRGNVIVQEAIWHYRGQCGITESNIMQGRSKVFTSGQAKINHQH